MNIYKLTFHNPLWISFVDTIKIFEELKKPLAETKCEEISICLNASSVWCKYIIRFTFHTNWKSVEKEGSVLCSQQLTTSFSYFTPQYWADRLMIWKSWCWLFTDSGETSVMRIGWKVENQVYVTINKTFYCEAVNVTPIGKVSYFMGKIRWNVEYLCLFWRLFIKWIGINIISTYPKLLSLSQRKY